MAEDSLTIEVGADFRTWVVAFSADGECLLSGGIGGVGVWQVRDGKRAATLETGIVSCLVVSKSGSLIAAGTHYGDVIVWNAKSCKRVFESAGGEDNYPIHAVDISPDSTCLISASQKGTATVWHLGTGKQLYTLPHGHDWAVAARYSSEGDQIATATSHCVRIWGSKYGDLIVEISVAVKSFHNRGLVWFNDHLLVISDGAIKRFNAVTGSPISEWPVPDTNRGSCIALPKHGQFIVYSAQYSISLWDMSTDMLLSRYQHCQQIRFIALSPNDQLLAIAGIDERIFIKDVNASLALTYPTPLTPVQPTDTIISEATFIDTADMTPESWGHDRLQDTEISLTRIITNSIHKSHHLFANRALVRSRLHHWDSGISDAEKSIKIRPSVIGYIAKSVALIGNGQKEDGCRVFDLAFRHCDPNHLDHLLLIKAVVLFVAGKHNDALSRIDDLIATAYMYFLRGSSHMERNSHDDAIHLFECACTHTRYCVKFDLFDVSLIFGWRFDDLGIRVRQRLCEALYTARRTEAAGKSLVELANTFEKEIDTGSTLTKWISDFSRRCLSASEKEIDAASEHVVRDGTSTCCGVLNSPILISLSREWAKATLAARTWQDALVIATNFTIQRMSVYRVICERLETMDRLIDASECFCQTVVDESLALPNAGHERSEWIQDFKRRCSGKLERLGDAMTNAERHGHAIPHYSAALALDLAAPHTLFVKRSKAYVARGLWQAALNDANQIIELDPLSPCGYERKHAALHKAGDYVNAINALEEMLLKMSQSSNPEIRDRRRKYIDPGVTRSVIREAVQDAIRDSPRMLINTISGRLFDKSEQASTFESFPVFNQLISSMTTHVDHARVEYDVKQYYRYAMFSHKWELNEPLFEDVIHKVVYELEQSPTREKLRKFCEVVRGAGLQWAWSDNCCINKADHFILQEALVSMFKWYRGSDLTVVYLRDSPFRRLVDSIWNSRAWTFQEYHASKVVRFYNNDWTPYKNLDIPNHKESPEIISEMEAATGIPARALMALQPGLDNIREKLYLASTRQTSFVEDAAYSLLGIFCMSLPVVYGEGDQALGRLLSQLLTSSGDTSILAWTGKSGSFNSCLPSSITVFKEPPTSHIPLAITGAKMDTMVASLGVSSINPTSVARLYDRLNELPVPLFAGKRMKLPCIVFKLGPLSVSRRGAEQIFRAQTDALTVVEMKTTNQGDLSRFTSLYLVHPWIDFLLDRQPVGSVIEMLPEERIDEDVIGELPLFASLLNPGATLTPSQSRASRFASRFGAAFGRTTARPADAASLRPPSTVAQADKQIHALQVLARLKQPFGAFLLTPNYGNVAAYSRVAAETLVTVRIMEITQATLGKLADRVRVLDVL